MPETHNNNAAGNEKNAGGSIGTKNSEVLGGMGSGPGSMPDTGTADRGSGSQGGSSAAGGPAEGYGGNNTGNERTSEGRDMEEGNDQGQLTDDSAETGSDMGTATGGATGETEGTP